MRHDRKNNRDFGGTYDLHNRKLRQEKDVTSFPEIEPAFFKELVLGDEFVNPRSCALIFRSRRMTKLSLIVVLFLVGLSLGGKKRASRGIDFKTWFLSKLRTPPKTTTATTTTTHATTSAPKTAINPAIHSGQVSYYEILFCFTWLFLFSLTT